MWFLALLLLACSRPRPSFDPVPIPAGPRPSGEFDDDYGNHYVITGDLWTQRPHGRFVIKKWVPSAGYLIAQNHLENGYASGQWTRIDYIRLEGMPPWEWAFCLSAYQAPSADSAEATRIADTEHPRTGCNGYPFSRLRPTSVARSDSAATEHCHQLYLAAGSDGPKLVAVDSTIVDGAVTPPLRCGHLRAQHPRIRSAE